MIDIYAAAGTFTETHKLATDAAALIKAVEGVPDIAMFRKNTAAFIHEGEYPEVGGVRRTSIGSPHGGN
jgi:hypothetical protein